MSRQFKVAMIGCGKRARAAAKGLQADPRCQVAALADLSAEAAESLDKDFAFGAKTYLDHKELLEKERPEVVVSSLWTGLHLPIFRDCVAAGVKAVLSEKPMAPNWADCREMARLAESSGCQLTFCHQRRYAPGNLLARRLIEEGVFGEIRRMDLYAPCDLLDCGTHSVDQALSFNGETPAKWVIGAVDASEIGQHFGLNSEKMAYGLIVFENGVRATIQAKGPDRDMPTGLRVEGANGLLEVRWDGQFGQAVVFDKPEWQPPELPAHEPVEQMSDVVRDTLDCYERGVEPPLSHRKALRASEIIYALYESARRRRAVELPLAIDDHPLDAIVREVQGAK